MKTGRTLSQLAAEIERQRETKVDVVAPAKSVVLYPHPQAEAGAKGSVEMIVGNHNFDINGIAHDQIGTHVKIPAAYYDRMLADEPDLLATNVNRWLGKDQSKRLIRTLDGRARAFLSDGYRPLENFDLAEAVLPVLMDLQVDILSCEITERRIYIKAVDKRLQLDVPTGKHLGDGSHTFFDTLSPAIIISNSEVGLGQLSVESGVYTKVCTNLAMIAANAFKKRHVGARLDVGTEAIAALLTDETKSVTDKAIWLQVRDIVKGAFEEARFEAAVGRIAETVEHKIVGDPVKVVDLSARKFGFTDGEKVSVLRHLIEGGSLNQYGLFNAVTRAAQDIPSYDRATEFEKVGGDIIDLPANEWRVLAEAA